MRELKRMTLIASLATSEQAQLAAEFKKDREAGALREINYKTIEPDFVGTDLERRALFNGLKNHAPEVNDNSSLEDLRDIKTRLLA